MLLLNKLGEFDLPALFSPSLQCFQLIFSNIKLEVMWYRNQKFVDVFFYMCMFGLWLLIEVQGIGKDVHLLLLLAFHSQCYLGIFIIMHHENMPIKFYIVKLEFTGFTLFFLFLLKNRDCGYSLEPPRRGGSNEYLQSLFWAGIWKKYQKFYLNLFLFWLQNFSIYLNRRVFVIAWSEPCHFETRAQLFKASLA